MTVEQLINALKEFDPAKVVLIEGENDYYPTTYVTNEVINRKPVVVITDWSLYNSEK